MKKILLLGDSIPRHHDDFVREELDGTAEVYFSNDTGRFAQYPPGLWKTGSPTFSSNF